MPNIKIDKYNRFNKSEASFNERENVDYKLELKVVTSNNIAKQMK